MGGNDDAGRIHKTPFLVSTWTLLALCLISVAARFYVRIGVQRQVAVDDGFVLLAICCLVAAMACLYHGDVIDNMYMVEAFIFDGIANAELPSDWIQRSFSYHVFVTSSLLLTWVSIISVKFSFLFLFKKLIDRIPRLMMYWWFVVVSNILVAAYGIAVYIVACPYFNDPRSLQCANGSRAWTAIHISTSHIILDIVSDFLILYIPVHIIWQIKVRWTHKVALAFSLCLTIVVIVVTIIRASGLHEGKKLDSVWETYWQIISAEVGIIMTALTGFRAFFVARSKKAGAGPGEPQGHGNQPTPPSKLQQWTSRSLQLALRLSNRLIPGSMRRRRSGSGGSSRASSSDGILGKGARAFADGNQPSPPPPHIDLPFPPRGMLTSLRSFIDRQGKTTASTTTTMTGTMFSSRLSTLAEEKDPAYDDVAFR